MADQRDSVYEIRHRVGILDLVSEYVTLKRAGKNHKGLCPFHSEKTPSFTVSDEFQTWHCFGCGEHGDVFSFLMKIENLTFTEALERLAKRAGVQLERTRGRQTSRKELLGRLNALAATYYLDLLKRTPAAVDYLRGRGFADQTIEQYRIGYAAPAWDGLVQHLGKKGIDLNDAEQAGLVIRSERGFYDRFRHRIVFPILDIQDRVIGFGGRALGDDHPKYVNSPETPLFRKTRSLYGLNFARKAIAEEGYAIVVEGYTDVIAAHQAGFQHCVATLGTALTREHIDILSRYASRIVLAYDSDSAGMAAALRGASMFEEAECDVRIARLPGDEDPDSLLRKGSVSEFAAVLADALPIVDYKLAVLREEHDLSSPAGRAAMLKGASRILAEVRSFVEREKHIKELISYHPNWDVGLTQAQNQIRADVQALTRRQSSPEGRRAQEQSIQRPRTALEKAERSVLRVVASGDERAETVVESLDPSEFSDETSRSVASVLFGAFRSEKGICLPEILNDLDKDESEFLSELAIDHEGPPISEKALEDYVALIKNSKVRRMRASDVLAPGMKNGTIDPSDWRSSRVAEEYETFLRRSGKRVESDDQQRSTDESDC